MKSEKWPWLRPAMAMRTGDWAWAGKAIRTIAERRARMMAQMITEVMQKAGHARPLPVALFVAQRGHGVDSRRAAGRNVAGEERGREEDRDGAGEGERVVRPGAEEE